MKSDFTRRIFGGILTAWVCVAAGDFIYREGLVSNPQPDSCYYILSVVSKLAPDAQLDDKSIEILRSKLVILSQFYSTSFKKTSFTCQQFPPSFVKCQDCNGSGNAYKTDKRLTLNSGLKPCGRCYGCGSIESDSAKLQRQAYGTFRCACLVAISTPIASSRENAAEVLPLPSPAMATQCLALADRELAKADGDIKQSMKFCCMAADFGAPENEISMRLSDGFYALAYKSCKEGHYGLAYAYLSKVTPPSDPEKRKAFDAFFYKVGDWANDEKNREAQANAAAAIQGAMDQANQQRRAEMERMKQTLDQINDRLRNQ